MVVLKPLPGGFGRVQPTMTDETRVNKRTTAANERNDITHSLEKTELKPVILLAICDSSKTLAASKMRPGRTSIQPVRNRDRLDAYPTLAAGCDVRAKLSLHVQPIQSIDPTYSLNIPTLPQFLQAGNALGPP